jgi:hypothetical protein
MPATHTIVEAQRQFRSYGYAPPLLFVDDLLVLGDGTCSLYVRSHGIAASCAMAGLKME